MDYAHALAVDPSGRYLFVTGTTYRSASSLDYVTVAYKAR
jgi:hypothetical protein